MFHFSFNLHAKVLKIDTKKSIFWHFSSFGKMPKMSILATVQDKMEWREIVFTQLFMTLNVLFNNMVS